MQLTYRFWIRSSNSPVPFSRGERKAKRQVLAGVFWAEKTVKRGSKKVKKRRRNGLKTGVVTFVDWPCFSIACRPSYDLRTVVSTLVMFSEGNDASKV